MNCKILKTLVICTLLLLVHKTSAQDSSFKKTVHVHSDQRVPGTEIDIKRYDIHLLPVYPSHTTDTMTFWDSKTTHRIKDIHAAVATTRKIFKRPFQVIGIMEYRNTLEKAEYMEKLEIHEKLNP